jgi:tRNA dimethylallyltransferase
MHDTGLVSAPRPVAIVGPTATGKSDLAIEVALAVRGEVINADSMQLYRGMDVGTAKVPIDQRRGVPHHLLDVLDVTERASVAAYQRAARAQIDDCLARDVVPVLVGGSGLYVRAVLDRLDFPGTDPAIRARLESELAERGPLALHERLSAVDPTAAQTILATNGRRIVRALEVVELTGTPFTAQLPAHEPEAFLDASVIGLAIERPALHERIARRVDRMWADGFVDEVRGLERRGLRDGVTASRALGYRQVLDFLDGTRDEDDARAATVQATRQFARRQATWFRADPRATWLQYDAEDLRDLALASVGSAR